MIADVCKDVGFDDYTSFYRQFVSTLGVSPVEFKKPSALATPHSLEVYA